jgi:hypothetical protein
MMRYDCYERQTVNNYNITDLNSGLFYFSSWLPENFSDADADGYRHRQVKEQPESEAALGCGG